MPPPPTSVLPRQRTKALERVLLASAAVSKPHTPLSEEDELPPQSRVPDNSYNNRPPTTTNTFSAAERNLQSPTPLLGDLQNLRNGESFSSLNMSPPTSVSPRQRTKALERVLLTSAAVSKPHTPFSEEDELPPQSRVPDNSNNRPPSTTNTFSAAERNLQRPTPLLGDLQNLRNGESFSSINMPPPTSVLPRQRTKTLDRVLYASAAESKPHTSSATSGARTRKAVTESESGAIGSSSKSATRLRPSSLYRPSASSALKGVSSSSACNSLSNHSLLSSPSTPRTARSSTRAQTRRSLTTMQVISKKKTGAGTVPGVVFDGVCIGGGNDTVHPLVNEKLKEILKDHSVEDSQPHDVDCGDTESNAENIEEFNPVVEEELPSRSIPLKSKLPNLPSAFSSCTCGNRTLDDRCSWIQCDFCLTWFHSACVDLSDIEVEELGKSNEQWFCLSCSCAAKTQTNTNVRELVECSGCHKFFKGLQGLRIHQSKKKCVSPVDSLPQVDAHAESLVDKLVSWKKSIRILKRIPKGARSSVAYKLAAIMEKCVAENSEDSWTDLMLFPYRALYVPVRNNKSLASNVKKNLSQPKENLGNPSKAPYATSLQQRVESKVSDGDLSGAIRLLSSTDSMAEESEETFAALSSKHPCPSRPLEFSSPVPADSLVVDDGRVLKAILSFSNGSAGGIDGLRPQHLKDLCGPFDAGKKLISSITKLCNLILSGTVCDFVRHVLFGANLVALKKKDGGIRPIAVGTTLRRLTSKLACRSVYGKAGDYLRPHQLGFATKGGCEAAVHATRSFLPFLESGKIILKLDVKNAFNSAERDCILVQALEMTPNLYNFFRQGYQSPSSLFYGNKIIQSQVGVQQGDPSGPLLFSLAIHPTVLKLNAELNVWYLDDGTLGGTPDTVLSDFATVIDDFNRIGLEINPSKCEIYHSGSLDESIKQQFQILAPGVVFSESGFNLLGSPLDDAALVPMFVKKKEVLKLMVERLVLLNSHVAYFLLKHAVGMPRLIYFLRTTPLWKHKNILNDVDLLFRDCLVRILNVPLNDFQSQIASFPTLYGGLGIRSCKDLSLPAFLSSVLSTFELITSLCPYIIDESGVDNFSGAWNAWLCVNPEILPERPTSQKSWDNCNLERLVSSLTFNSDLEKAVFLANRIPEASAWLTVLPSKALDTKLDNNSFKIAVALRLCSRICVPHACICGSEVDELGHHGLHCKKSAGRHLRHYMINNILHRAIVSSGTPAHLEPSGLCRDDGKRPDGASLLSWKQGQMLVWDATCVSTTAPSYLTGSAKEARSTASKAAEKKKSKYKEIIAQDHIFVPFAVETFGPFCEDALVLVSDVGERLCSCTGEPRSRLFLTQRISVAIQKGNAACVMGTFGTSSQLDELFYLF